MEEAFVIATSRRKVPERTQRRWFFPVCISMVEREWRYRYTPCLELKKWRAGDCNPTHRTFSSRGQKSLEGKEWQAGESRCLSHFPHYVGDAAAAFLENGRRACKKWSVRSSLVICYGVPTRCPWDMLCGSQCMAETMDSVKLSIAYISSSTHSGRVTTIINFRIEQE